MKEKSNKKKIRIKFNLKNICLEVICSFYFLKITFMYVFKLKGHVINTFFS